jgi:hypothetical protein
MIRFSPNTVLSQYAYTKIHKFLGPVFPDAITMVGPIIGTNNCIPKIFSDTPMHRGESRRSGKTKTNRSKSFGGLINLRSVFVLENHSVCLSLSASIPRSELRNGFFFPRPCGKKNGIPESRNLCSEISQFSGFRYAYGRTKVPRTTSP